MQQAIHPLDAETRSKIRSTQILTSLPHIISELVQNSLDANANRIEVGINTQEWECWVRDDGIGISKAGLSILGQDTVKARYVSSKTYDSGSLTRPNTFGFRGEALASAADISCLEICSRTKKSNETSSVILKGGKVLYLGPAVRWVGDSSGTVVCVRDAFHNVPVRRKSHPSPSKSLNIVKRDLKILALVNHHVAFSLVEISQESSGTQDVKVLTIPKTGSPLETFRSVFGRALVEHATPIDDQERGIILKGFISLDGATSKAYQFIYINNRFLETSELYTLIEDLFAQSTFGKHAFDDEGETSLRPNGRRSPRKGEKRPVFVLSLSIPSTQVDFMLEPSKSIAYLAGIDAARLVISRSMLAFLRQHDFLSEPTLTPQNGSDIEMNTPKITSKGARQSPSKYYRSSKENATPRTHELDLGIKPDSVPTPSAFSLILKNPPPVTETTENPEESVTWHTSRSVIKERSDLPRNTLSNNGAVDDLTRSQDITTISKTIKNTIDEWSNPTYPSIELRSFVAPKRSLGSSIPESRANIAPDNGQTPAMYRPSSITFNPSSLAQADVIGQVDHKFIACVVKGDHANEEILLLIDQHAADERIRVERFLKQLCKSASLKARRQPFTQPGDSDLGTTHLSPHIAVLLTKEDVDLLRTDEVKQALEVWGLRFDEDSIINNEEGEGRIQVSIQTVPSVLQKQLCRGNELQDTLRGIFAEINERGVTSWHMDQFPADEEIGWIRAWRNCPNNLLELVNSRACRGAIMFNDVLAKDKCARLVKQLAESLFPFQCAHGRPSIAPLVSLASVDKRMKGVWGNERDLRASQRNIKWREFKQAHTGI
ncbi:hypothetical protein CPB86DRAFT_807713 [Serendipita vermifera]|nr:hypothetical protein CPB86DRAFT_807713 [Serendipita vermifera]